MAEKHKPQEDIFDEAATFMTHPQKATPEDIKRMAARLLDDQRNDPETRGGGEVEGEGEIAASALRRRGKSSVGPRRRAWLRE